MTNIFGCDNFPFFCILLIFMICLQSCDAVKCKRVMSAFDILAGNTVECPSTCAMYQCSSTPGQGCPSDFFDDCSGYPKATEFIKNKNFDNLAYSDGIVYYVSGCETIICLADKQRLLVMHVAQQTVNEIQSSMNHPIWYCEKPGDNDSCSHAIAATYSNGFIKLTEIWAKIGLIFGHIF